MIFQSCGNPSAVFVVFSEILLCVFSNNLYDFVERFKRYKVRGGYSKLYGLNVVSSVVITRIYSLFRLAAQLVHLLICLIILCLM